MHPHMQQVHMDCSIKVYNLWFSVCVHLYNNRIRGDLLECSACLNTNTFELVIHWMQWAPNMTIHGKNRVSEYKGICPGTLSPQDRILLSLLSTLLICTNEGGLIELMKIMGKIILFLKNSRTSSWYKVNEASPRISPSGSSLNKWIRIIYN